MTPAFNDALRHIREPSLDIRRDIILSLSSALGSAWKVHREIDCVGDVSIVVMPASDDDPSMPTFVLYEAGGEARVGTIRRDEWQADQGFATVQQAAISGILTAVNLAQHHSDTA